MLNRLILLFILVPLLELGLLIKVGQYLGALNTVLLVLFTAILGGYLAQIEGGRVWKKFNTSLQHGVIPTDELFDGVLIFVGGILLLAPGIITDLLGFFLLFPFGRSIARRIIKRKFANKMKAPKYSGYYFKE